LVHAWINRCALHLHLRNNLPDFVALSARPRKVYQQKEAACIGRPMRRPFFSGHCLCRAAAQLPARLKRERGNQPDLRPCHPGSAGGVAVFKRAAHEVQWRVLRVANLAQAADGAGLDGRW
jgi:hypothetical protein